MDKEKAKPEVDPRAAAEIEDLRQKVLLAQAFAMCDEDFSGDPVEAGMDVLLQSCVSAAKK